MRSGARAPRCPCRATCPVVGYPRCEGCWEEPHEGACEPAAFARCRAQEATWEAERKAHRGAWLRLCKEHPGEARNLANELSCASDETLQAFVIRYLDLRTAAREAQQMLREHGGVEVYGGPEHRARYDRVMGRLFKLAAEPTNPEANSDASLPPAT